MDKIILIICHEQYWQVRFEKDKFSLDCKSKEVAFNCAWQLICLSAGEIDYVKVQMEDGTIQETWTCEELDNMLAASYPNLIRSNKLAL